MGIFGCSFVPLALITIGKTVSAPDKSRYIGTFFAISYISTFVSVFLSGFLHWRLIYFIPAFLSFFLFLSIMRFMDEFDFRREKFKLSYVQTFKEREALCFFAVIMVGSFFYHSIQQQLGVYFKETFSLSQFVISSIFTVATLCAIFFEFTGGFLGVRVGNINVARIGFILMSLFALCLLLSKNYFMLFFLIALWGSGWALTHVGLSSHLTHFPDRILRDASSLNSSLRFSFGGLGACVGGIFASRIGFSILFFLTAVIIFLLGVFLNRIVSVQGKECHG
jgi:predicted MFS family arabinose efflux permease